MRESLLDVKYMVNEELIERVGKYIDKYYEPVTDDIKMDETFFKNSERYQLYTK